MEMGGDDPYSARIEWENVQKGRMTSLRKTGVIHPPV